MGGGGGGVGILGNGGENGIERIKIAFLRETDFSPGWSSAPGPAVSIRFSIS